MPFPEEYPTAPQSHVLNGAIFALWGVRDVSLTTGRRGRRRLHDDLLATLTTTCDRWDTGRWSRYDLFPSPPLNISSSFYHHLHISQLKALHLLYGAPEFGALAGRFEAYEANPLLRGIAFTRKVSYRIAIPRHRISKDTQASTGLEGRSERRIAPPSPQDSALPSDTSLMISPRGIADAGAAHDRRLRARSARAMADHRDLGGRVHRRRSGRPSARPDLLYRGERPPDLAGRPLGRHVRGHQRLPEHLGRSDCELVHAGPLSEHGRHGEPGQAAAPSERLARRAPRFALARSGEPDEHPRRFARRRRLRSGPRCWRTDSQMQLFSGERSRCTRTPQR